MRLAPALAVLATGALAGCGASTSADPKADGADARVVVAVIDTTFNPYHDYIYAGSELYKNAPPSAVTQQVLDDVGVTPERVLTVTRTGNLQKDKAADAAMWKAIRRGKPYWIKGTNIIGVSFCDEYPMLVPDSAKNPHGVGTSASVLQANPEAVIVMVEFCDSIGSSDSEKYTYNHPAVDIITTSYGPATPVLGTPPLPVPGDGMLQYDAVVNMGKLHFNSAGNGAGFTPLIGNAGEWWSIGVSGSEEYSSNGQQVMSANYADFVADYTQQLPYTMDNEKEISDAVPGTSFSTPRSAGVASKILLEARRALGHPGGIVLRDGVGIMAEGNGKTVTNWQIRRALEEAAYIGYGVQDFDPAGAASDPWPSVPFNDVAPWTQMGWGEITADPEKGVVAEALAHLGFGTPTRTKDVGFCEYQAMNIRVRMNAWSAYGAGDYPVPDNSYIFCDSALNAVPTPIAIAPGEGLPVDTGSPTQCTSVLDPLDAEAVCSVAE